MNALVKSLTSHMKTLPVIDAHSHLPDEEELMATPPDVFTRIFCHYSLTSAVTSGLGSRERLRDTTVPLNQRFAEFAPCLNAVRDCGYVRAALRTAAEYYGVEEVNADTVPLLQRRIQADDGPGQTERVMDFLHIETVINQHTYARPGRTAAVSRAFMVLLGMEQFQAALPGLYNRLAWERRPVESLESFFLSWFDYEMEKNSFVGVKLMSSFAFEERPADAPEQYRISAESGHCRVTPAQADAMLCWLRHRLLEECGRRGLPVAVHCGINWDTTTDIGGTFYHNDPRYIMDWAVRYPGTVFDLYHAGIPWVRDIAVIANQCPNVYLNLVWAYQIAPEMTVNFLSEWLDLVPANKIIGFGGDSTTPEKTVGALSLARECIARALAARVARHGMTESRAADLCRAWLYDNPKRIYRL
jgi:predicted TIM-barrel fold metal-dependent hydrolase